MFLLSKQCAKKPVTTSQNKIFVSSVWIWGVWVSQFKNREIIKSHRKKNISKRKDYQVPMKNLHKIWLVFFPRNEKFEIVLNPKTICTFKPLFRRSYHWFLTNTDIICAERESLNGTSYFHKFFHRKHRSWTSFSFAVFTSIN